MNKITFIDKSSYDGPAAPLPQARGKPQPDWRKQRPSREQRHLCSGSGPRPCLRAPTRCPPGSSLLQCPQPFLLRVLSSYTFSFSPCSLPLSPLCFPALGKFCVTPLTASLLRLSSLDPSPGLAAQGCCWGCVSAAGAAPPLPPSLPPSRLASSLAVKRVEKNEKRKLVTPEYAQRKVGKHLLNTDPREALGSVLYRQNPNLRGGQLERGLHRCGSPT